jgi:hypothetical protein
MKFFILTLVLSFLTGCFSKVSQRNKHEYDDSLTRNSQVTSDVKIIGKAKGIGNQVELFGFLRFGDSGRANYEYEYLDIYPGNEMMHASKQSAVYNALEGQTEAFLIDPQFRTTKNNFIIFKTTKTEVVGQKATKDNYRQVKRFTDDRTDTLPVPHTYTVNRGGVESTTITASPNFPQYIADTISVVDSESDVKSVQINKTLDRNGEIQQYSQSLNSIGERLRQSRQKLNNIARSYEIGE